MQHKYKCISLVSDICFLVSEMSIVTKNNLKNIMKKIDLKKLKGSLSRDEQRTIMGGKKI
jgi:hypothetical protein